jgi:hypothetical protein
LNVDHAGKTAAAVGWTAPHDAVDGSPATVADRSAAKNGGKPWNGSRQSDWIIAKSVFPVHSIDAAGDVVLRRRLTPARLVAFFAKLAPCLVGKLRRAPPRIIGPGNCASGSRCPADAAELMLRRMQSVRRTTRPMRKRSARREPSTSDKDSWVSKGVGPVLASAFVASVPDPAMFKSGPNLAAWIGLVRRQNSSGGKQRWSE